MNGPARVNLRKTRNGFITQTIWAEQSEGYGSPIQALSASDPNEEEHVFKTIAEAAGYLMGVYKGE